MHKHSQVYFCILILKRKCTVYGAKVSSKLHCTVKGAVYSAKTQVYIAPRFEVVLITQAFIYQHITHITIIKYMLLNVAPFYTATKKTA